MQYTLRISIIMITSIIHANVLVEVWNSLFTMQIITHSCRDGGVGGKLLSLVVSTAMQLCRNGKTSDVGFLTTTEQSCIELIPFRIRVFCSIKRFYSPVHNIKGSEAHSQASYNMKGRVKRWAQSAFP